MTPLEYLREIADWVRRMEPAPLTWAHVVFVSLNTAMSFSPYRGEPLLRVLRDELRDRVLDRLHNDAGMTALQDAELVRASGLLIDYERGREFDTLIQDRYLRWLSDRPPLDDWTLRVWRDILAETGVKPEHFGGARPWATVRVPRAEVARESGPSWQDELDRLVGLKEVKRQVVELQRFAEVERMRVGRGLPANRCSLHQVFLGNPGTGKTTVARILARAYQSVGLLEKGHLVEVDRSGLVGSYVGHTEEQTDKVVKSALGGVLFIDEAYSLARGGREDFGGRAIDTLVKRMEDYRDRFVVVVAGYAREMEVFIQSNPGLRSRFDSYIHFPDYSNEELVEIFRRTVAAAKFHWDSETEDAVGEYLRAQRIGRGTDLGNARDVRTLWETMLRRQAMRVWEAGGGNPSGDIGGLTTLVRKDVPVLASGQEEKAGGRGGVKEGRPSGSQ